MINGIEVMMTSGKNVFCQQKGYQIVLSIPPKPSGLVHITLGAAANRKKEEGDLSISF